MDTCASCCFATQPIQVVPPSDSGQTKVAVSLRRDEPLSFRRQYSMQADLCERVAKAYRPDGCERDTARLVSGECLDWRDG